MGEAVGEAVFPGNAEPVQNRLTDPRVATCKAISVSVKVVVLGPGSFARIPVNPLTQTADKVPTSEQSTPPSLTIWSETNLKSWESTTYNSVTVLPPETSTSVVVNAAVAGP